MMFFLDADENVYARYGGRDAKSPDARQSLKGLHYTMKSVLAMHKSKEKVYAKPTRTKPVYVRDFQNGRSRRRCLHCHDVKELIYSDKWKKGTWTRDIIWRYPLPDQIGMVPEVDRGNVVDNILPGSAADLAGLKKGDIVRILNNVPIHSIADAQFALDRAPGAGKIGISWEHNGKPMSAKLTLTKDWEKGDISWRPSSWALVPSLHVFGDDLTEAEKLMLGLKADRLAFRQQERVHSHAKKAGIQAGDIILGVDGNAPKMNMIAFLKHIRTKYITEDKVTIQILRHGKKMDIPMTLIR